MSDFIIHIIMMSMVILICSLPKVKEQKNSIKLRDILALCINSQIYCSWIQAWFFSFDEHKRSSLLQSPASEDYKQQRDADQVTIRNSTIHVLNKDITQHKVCTAQVYFIQFEYSLFYIYLVVQYFAECPCEINLGDLAMTQFNLFGEKFVNLETFLLNRKMLTFNKINS